MDFNYNSGRNAPNSRYFTLCGWLCRGWLGWWCCWQNYRLVLRHYWLIYHHPKLTCNPGRNETNCQMFYLWLVAKLMVLLAKLQTCWEISDLYTNTLNLLAVHGETKTVNYFTFGGWLCWRWHSWWCCWLNCMQHKSEIYVRIPLF